MTMQTCEQSKTVCGWENETVVVLTAVSSSRPPSHSPQALAHALASVGDWTHIPLFRMDPFDARSVEIAGLSDETTAVLRKTEWLELMLGKLLAPKTTTRASLDALVFLAVGLWMGFAHGDPVAKAHQRLHV